MDSSYMACGLLYNASTCHIGGSVPYRGGTGVNVLGIGGIVLLILGIVILVAPDTLNILVAIVFIFGGGYLAAKGFGLPVP